MTDDIEMKGFRIIPRNRPQLEVIFLGRDQNGILRIKREDDVEAISAEDCKSIYVTLSGEEIDFEQVPGVIYGDIDIVP